MSELEELWNIQQHFNCLKNIQDNIDKFSKKDGIKESYIRLKKIENRLVDSENKIKEMEKLLNRNNLILKEYDYQLEKIEKSLYHDDIHDLKQLNFLDMERQNIKKQIEEKEKEILLQMDELENMKSNIIKLQNEYKVLRKEYASKIKEYKIKIEEFKAKEAYEKTKIEELKLKVSKEVFEEYKSIVKSKGVAVVKVIDDRCSGCNMFLPKMILDKLKNNNEIVHCENCNRILYMEKENE